MIRITIDMSSAEGEEMFQALSAAREQYLASQHRAGLVAAARAMNEAAEARWAARAANDAWLASLGPPKNDHISVLLRALEPPFNYDAAHAAATKAAILGGHPLLPPNTARDRLRRTLHEEASVFALRWMCWGLVDGMARHVCDTADEIASLLTAITGSVDRSDSPDPLESAGRAAIDSVEQSGVDLRGEMLEAHRHMYRVLLQNRKLYPGGCFNVVLDAADEIFAEYCPGLAPQLSHAFYHVMHEVDSANYNSDGTLKAA
jgi:hypothetical protein